VPVRAARRRGGVPVVGSAERLLGLPVRLNGIPLGTPVDLLVDLERRRAIGLEVLCGDEALRYLPLAAADVRDDEIAIGSALLLFDARDLAWYRRRAASLAALRGSGVRVGRRLVGRLATLVVAADGTIPAVVVEDDGRTRRVDFDDRVAIDRAGKASAA
jgi:hypothetical protein